ncbi:Dihydrolipoamide dehydrogenase of pyruvate dehydrogenase complex [Methylophaga frappieri]|uniref:Dihydrolipoyl dehydrogenase n=1 Tax=Methylophaga frappieri (strain ATCC BAA-2434 / DSM 25690 / JAM7) TaxID=754477 RepID=I1YEF5_METFJ|nr:dihydrolipoyl dehydrogenase [Methylophaga frappieri]AFJ01298.1 Dihydrolipoamide dehydrogenase of pyruvate dehydrogenase complex [Methylophaga frappieri]
MSFQEVKVPDIGDFDAVEIIEVLVSVGDEITENQDIITLESDKAAMEIPSPIAGKITELLVSVGDKVAEGDVILKLEAVTSDASAASSEPEVSQDNDKTTEKPAPQAAAKPDHSDMHAEVVVLGSGPGGYTAAFRAADLGKQVILIERYERIGGVCLNVGCIPSKALLHTAQIINEASHMADNGVSFNKPDIDLDKLTGWKNNVINKLTGGLKALAKQRKVTVVQGEAQFSSANSLTVTTPEGDKTVSFDNCIIAAGSRVTKIPVFPNDDPRMMDSTDALNLEDIPKRLLVIGGGIIGLEMATVYHALGSKISVVELQDSLIPGADKDIVKPLQQRIEKQYESIYLKTKVSAIEPLKSGLKVTFDGDNAPEPQTYDKILVAVGRTPNGKLINADAAGVNVNDYGFIEVDGQMRTNQSHIFAIGDIVGQPMLAHKATHEGKVAAEVIAGQKSVFEPMTIPSVAYTDPEVAWMGLNEAEAKAQGIDYVKGAFPWAASGRSLSLDRDEGLTKALFEKSTGRIIGATIVGPNAGELIAEAVLALEMGADAEDIGLSIHPHPTLSETLGFAAEMAEGSITDLLPPKKTLHSK